eukprot:12117830-Alexandrium_andersonii.AAC.1
MCIRDRNLVLGNGAVICTGSQQDDLFASRCSNARKALNPSKLPVLSSLRLQAQQMAGVGAASS